MSKRAFQRIGNLLRDIDKDAEGVTRVRELVSEPGPLRRDSTQGESVSPPAADVEALLRGLKAEDASALEGLLPFVPDPRVSAALLEAVRTKSMPLLGNIAQVLGQARMSDAVAPLRARLSELTADARTFEDDAFHNARAGALAAVAGALLRIQPQRPEPVETLLQLLDHPSASNRRIAAAALAEALTEKELPSRTTEVIRDRMRSLVQTGDPGLFATIAPTVFGEQTGLVLARCEGLLKSTSVGDRETAIALLVKLGAPEAQDLLAQHVVKEAELRLACLVALRVGDRLPSTWRRKLVQRAFSQDSPSIRHDGLLLLSSLDAEISRPLAKKALRDEPDPMMRSRLEAIAGS